MTKMELEVYSEKSNLAVVTPPGRSFPGSVIQGDSLANLCNDVREIAIWVDSHSSKDDEVRWAIQEVQRQLLDRLLHYQSVLQANDMALPYATAAGSGDLVNLVNPGA